MKRRARGRSVSHSWFAITVATFVALVASGLPELVVEIVTGETVDCAVDCEGSDGQRHCPPNCSVGSCAKVAPYVSAPRAMVQVLLAAADRSTLAVDTYNSHDNADEVFHPPQA